MSTNTTKPTAIYWVISIVALLWNLMGASSYLMQAYMTNEQLEAMTTAERALYDNAPAWTTAAFAIAVFGGLLAAIALLLRKKWAKPLFILSLIAAVAQFIHWLFLTNAVEVYGPTTYIMPILVIVFGIYEIYFTKKAIAKGIL